MPLIVPAFLHRPLPGLAPLFSTQASEWLIEGLAIIAPRRLREAGWRPVYLLVRTNPLADDAVPLAIERSLLGETRLSPRNGDRRTPLLAVELAPSEIFETRVDLPSDARGALREAIAHRIDTLSPLPASDVEFAVGRAAPSRAGRLNVPIAIVRKKTIEETLQSPDGEKIGLIGAGADERGVFRYLFYRRSQAPEDRRSALARLLAIAVALSICVFGAGAQLDRQIASLTAHEAALIGALRAEKDEARFLAEPLPAAPPGRSIEGIAADLVRLSAELSDGVWLEEISIGVDGLSASGYAREGVNWPNGIKATLSPSDRPGVERLALRLAEEGAQ